jgi:hypothetical protein
MKKKERIGRIGSSFCLLALDIQLASEMFGVSAICVRKVEAELFSFLTL